MGNMFRSDSQLIRLLTRIANLIIISVLWCIACIPLITIVPASAALYHAEAECIQVKGNGVARDFLIIFKRELRQGILLSLLTIVSGVMVFFCLFFGWNNICTHLGFFYLIFGMLLTLIWFSTSLHLPVILSEFEGNNAVILRLTMYMASIRPGQTLGMIVLLAVLMLLTAYCPILIFLTPGLYMDILCNNLKKGLHKVAAAIGAEKTTVKAAATEEVTLAEEPVFSALEQAMQMEQEMQKNDTTIT